MPSKSLFNEWVTEWIRPGASKIMNALRVTHYKCWCMCACAQLGPTLCDPMDCSLPGSSVHGISQERILEWVAISFSRWSCWPRDWTWVSCIGRQILYHWATWESPRVIGPRLPWALGPHVIDSIFINHSIAGHERSFFHLHSNYLDFYVTISFHHTDVETIVWTSN